MNVYFVLAGSRTWQRIKIGKARDVAKRIAELQVGSPVALKLLGSIKATSDAHATGIEQGLHRTFKQYCVGGEWFTAAQPLREFILASCNGDQAAAAAALEWAEVQMRKKHIKAIRFPHQQHVR